MLILILVACLTLSWSVTCARINFYLQSVVLTGFVFFSHFFLALRFLFRAPDSAKKIATKVAKITKTTKFREAIDKTFDGKMQIRGRICCTYFIYLYLIISFAKKRKANNNKQTNRKNVGRPPQQLWPIKAGADTTTTNNKDKY